MRFKRFLCCGAPRTRDGSPGHERQHTNGLHTNGASRAANAVSTPLQHLLVVQQVDKSDASDRALTVLSPSHSLQLPSTGTHHPPAPPPPAPPVATSGTLHHDATSSHPVATSSSTSNDAPPPLAAPHHRRNTSASLYRVSASTYASAQSSFSLRRSYSYELEASSSLLADSPAADAAVAHARVHSTEAQPASPTVLDHTRSSAHAAPRRTTSSAAYAEHAAQPRADDGEPRGSMHAPATASESQKRKAGAEHTAAARPATPPATMPFRAPSDGAATGTGGARAEPMRTAAANAHAQMQRAAAHQERFGRSGAGASPLSQTADWRQPLAASDGSRDSGEAMGSLYAVNNLKAGVEGPLATSHFAQPHRPASASLRPTLDRATSAVTSGVSLHEDGDAWADVHSTALHAEHARRASRDADSVVAAPRENDDVGYQDEHATELEAARDLEGSSERAARGSGDRKVVSLAPPTPGASTAADGSEHAHVWDLLSQDHVRHASQRISGAPPLRPGAATAAALEAHTSGLAAAASGVESSAQPLSIRPPSAVAPPGDEAAAWAAAAALAEESHSWLQADAALRKLETATGVSRWALARRHAPDTGPLLLQVRPYSCVRPITIVMGALA